MFRGQPSAYGSRIEFDPGATSTLVYLAVADLSRTKRVSLTSLGQVRCGVVASRRTTSFTYAKAVGVLSLKSQQRAGIDPAWLDFPCATNSANSTEARGIPSFHVVGFKEP